MKLFLPNFNWVFWVLITQDQQASIQIVSLTTGQASCSPQILWALTQHRDCGDVLIGLELGRCRWSTICPRVSVRTLKQESASICPFFNGRHCRHKALYGRLHFSHWGYTYGWRYLSRGCGWVWSAMENKICINSLRWNDMVLYRRQAFETTIIWHNIKVVLNDKQSTSCFLQLSSKDLVTTSLMN